jgi:hypothetical protein
MVRHPSRHSSTSPPLLTLSTVSPRLALAELPQPADVFRCRTSSPGGVALLKSPTCSTSPEPDSHCTSTSLHCLHCRSSWTPAAHLRAERVHLRHHLAQYARTPTTAVGPAAAPHPPWRHVLAVLSRQALGVTSEAARPASVPSHRPSKHASAAAHGGEDSRSTAMGPPLSPARSASSAHQRSARATTAPRKASGPPKVVRVRRMPVRLPHFYAVRALERAAKHAGMASGRISGPTTGLAHVSLRFARRWTRWVELCAPAEPQMPATGESAHEMAPTPPRWSAESAMTAVAPGRLDKRRDGREQDGWSEATPSRMDSCCTPPGQDT